MLLSFARGSGWDQFLRAMAKLATMQQGFVDQLQSLIFYVLPPLYQASPSLTIQKSEREGLADVNSVHS